MLKKVFTGYLIWATVTLINQGWLWGDVKEAHFALSSLFPIPVEAAHSAPNDRVSAALSGNISRAQSDRIVNRLAGKRFDSFSDFVTEVYNVGQPFLSSEQKNAIAKFVAHERLKDSHREIMFRVLGIFAQLKYGGESLGLLNELLKPVDGSTESLTLLLKDQAERHDLRLRPVSERLFELRFSKRAAVKRSDGGKRLLFYVPLKINTDRPQSDAKSGNAKPLSKRGGFLYGENLRAGSSALAAVINAMRVVQEEKVSMRNDVRLLIDLDDSAENLKQYLKTFSKVDYVINLNDSVDVLNSLNFDSSRSVEQKLGQEITSNSWHQTLLEVYRENMITSQGDAHNLPLTANSLLLEGVEFTFPLSGKSASKEAQVQRIEPQESKPQESKSLDEFLLNIQMLTELLARLAQKSRV